MVMSKKAFSNQIARLLEYCPSFTYTPETDMKMLTGLAANDARIAMQCQLIEQRNGEQS